MTRRVVMCCRPQGAELHEIHCGTCAQIANGCGVHLAAKECRREILFRPFLTAEEILRNKALRRRFRATSSYIDGKVRAAKRAANM